MATNDFECVLRFDDLDLSQPDLWRKRMIGLVNDKAFGVLMSDLVTTGLVIGELPVTREWGGSCSIGAGVGPGGASGNIGCSIHF